MTTTKVAAEHVPRLRWGIGVLLGAGVRTWKFRNGGSTLGRVAACRSDDGGDMGPVSGYGS